FRGQGLGAVGQTGCVGIELDDRLEGANHGGGSFGDAAVADEDFLGGGGELEQSLPVREPALLRTERIGLAWVGRDRADLLDLVAQEIELAFPVACIVLEPAESTACGGRTPIRVNVRSDGRRVLGARIPIKEGRLRGGIQEPKGTVLSVDLDEARAEIIQGRGGGQLAAYART